MIAPTTKQRNPNANFRENQTEHEIYGSSGSGGGSGGGGTGTDLSFNKKFTKENLNKIFKAQTTDKERKKRSKIIINNNKTKKDFIFSVEKVLTELIK